ncbi:hypothetical protein JTB14_021186 [Gonioctena quinquepunctata]|nr:hypothetical protein JTB14_021186 [Gonioctena quinquepunctata]
MINPKNLIQCHTPVLEQIPSPQTSQSSPPKKTSDLTDSFIIKNLPQEIAEQRNAFRFFLRQEVAENNLFRVRISWNKTATLETKEPASLAEMRKRIRHVTGHANIEVTDFYAQKKPPETD